MVGSNYYTTLNIPDYSDLSIVKKAFRQLALKYHPDRNPNPSAAEAFKMYVAAYEILGDPDLKLKYDNRLKLGFNYESFAPPPHQNEREESKNWYAKMRQERDTVKEVEDITDYERSLEAFPLIWRFILILLVFFTGIITIVNGWYTTGSKIAFGGLLFFISSLFLWNEIFKQYWHKSLTGEETIKNKFFDKKAYQTFLKIFFGGIILCFGLAKLKKEWHLNYFGIETFAKIIYKSGGNYYISYSCNEIIYLRPIYNLPKNYENMEYFKIKCSTKEPEIWEFVEE